MPPSKSIKREESSPDEAFKKKAIKSSKKKKSKSSSESPKKKAIKSSKKKKSKYSSESPKKKVIKSSKKKKSKSSSESPKKKANSMKEVKKKTATHIDKSTHKKKADIPLRRVPLKRIVVTDIGEIKAKKIEFIKSRDFFNEKDSLDKKSSKVTKKEESSSGKKPTKNKVITKKESSSSGKPSKPPIKSFTKPKNYSSSSSPHNRSRGKSLTRIKINNNAQKEDLDDVKIDRIRSLSVGRNKSIVIHSKIKSSSPVRRKPRSSSPQRKEEEIKEELTLAVISPVSTYDNVMFYFRTLGKFILDTYQTSKGVDLYPSVKSGLGIVIEKYNDFMEAPSNPITNNIAKGFATTFIPSFRILLINLQRLVGKDVIIKFMNDIGFVENILLRQARSKMKEGIKMFIQLSNPLGWAYTLINLIKSGVDLTQFVNKGGLIGKLELVKNTGLGRFGAYDETLGYFLDGTLRKTFSSIITDLSTNLFDSNIGQISAYSLKLLVLGNEVTTISPYKVKDQNKSPIKSIMAPLNKQVAIVASSAAEGVIDQFLSYMNEDLFDEASLHIDDEEEKDYRDVLQSLGEVAGDQIAFILAAYATTLLPVTKTVSELLTDKEPVSRLQQAVSNGAALVALATAQSGAFLYNKLT